MYWKSLLTTWGFYVTDECKIATQWPEQNHVQKVNQDIWHGYKQEYVVS